jgi:hypothetical protein
VSHDDFETFCQKLEDLKGQVPLYRPRESMTERIMSSIERDRRQRVNRQVREWIPGIAVALLLGASWFFFRTPNGPLAVAGFPVL